MLATLDREWDGLARHRDFPDLALDNNIRERALRTPVVGRKNYYGSHAEWSAHLAARVWTITATAERHDLEPLAYLTAYLDACAQAGGRPPDGDSPGTVPALDSRRPPAAETTTHPRSTSQADTRTGTPDNPEANRTPGHQHGRAFTMPSHGITEYITGLRPNPTRHAREGGRLHAVCW